MIEHIEVTIQLGEESLVAGEMVCELSAGGPHGAFRYFHDYLQHPQAFALDPVSLPLKTGSFTIETPGVFGVFEDSLPDDWGRRLLIRKHHLTRHQQSLPNLLLALGSNGLGALSFHRSGEIPVCSTPVSGLYLQQLLEGAQAFEQGEQDVSTISLLLGAGSSPGGARPKALIYDEETNEQLIAKFPSIKDRVDVVRIEAATMSLAQKAGLTVPDCRIVECAGKPVLLVKRFDVVPDGRCHMISFQTLLKAGGYCQCRYADLIQVLRQHSADPATDIQALYRQMVFNAVIHNTDDHLKNFWMTCDIHQGWRLSPAFDLIPDVAQRGEHVLFFDIDPVYPGRKALEGLGKIWRIPQYHVIVDQVFDAVSHWREQFREFGILPTDTEHFSEIDRYLLT